MIKFKNKDGTDIAMIRTVDTVAVVRNPESETSYLRLQNSQVFVAVDYEKDYEIEIPRFDFDSVIQVGKQGVTNITAYLTVNNIGVT